jgi:hypothetical protein
MRHILGAVGVMAAIVLLAVSATMNWRFGYSLGRTEADGLVYAWASAAADCLKALVPFFFFGALRERMWSQAAASFVVGVVVTAYSLTSALGHAALNRNDTSGHRLAEAQGYKALRDDLKRAQDELGWIPPRRPMTTIKAELDGLKAQRLWTATEACKTGDSKAARDFCQKIHTLNGELGAAEQAGVLEAKIAVIQTKLERFRDGASVGEGDPQAAVLSKLLGLDMEKVQTALTIFVAILLEVGSGMGLYMAMSPWRLDPKDRTRKSGDGRTEARGDAAVPPEMAEGELGNRSRMTEPMGDVARFYRENFYSEPGQSISAGAIYEVYRAWCEREGRAQSSLPVFARELAALGIEKIKRADGFRYVDIARRSDRVDLSGGYGMQTTVAIE